MQRTDFGHGAAELLHFAREDGSCVSSASPERPPFAPVRDVRAMSTLHSLAEATDLIDTEAGITIRNLDGRNPRSPTDLALARDRGYLSIQQF